MTQPAPDRPAEPPDALPGGEWLCSARAEVARDPATLPRAFAVAARKVGRGPLRPGPDPAGIIHGTVDDAARAALVVTLAGAVGDREAAGHLRSLYEHGDSAERRGVLRGLDALTTGSSPRGEVGPKSRSRSLEGPTARTSDRPLPAADRLPADDEPGSGPELVATGTELAADALRTNDPGLVAAAVGPFGARYLDQHTWRHAVIKLVFMGVSLDVVSGLDSRRDAELARMARDLADERRAAGRPVPDDLARLAPGEPGDLARLHPREPGEPGEPTPAPGPAGTAVPPPPEPKE